MSLAAIIELLVLAGATDELISRFAARWRERQAAPVDEPYAWDEPDFEDDELCL